MAQKLLLYFKKRKNLHTATTRGGQPVRNQAHTRTSCRTRGAGGYRKALMLIVLGATGDALNRPKGHNQAAGGSLQRLAVDEFAEDGGRRDGGDLGRGQSHDVIEELEHAGSLGVGR